MPKAKGKKRSTLKRVWRGRKYKAPGKGQRIGAGKKGTAQRQIYRSGGGKQTMAIWATLSQQQRKNIRRRAMRNPKKRGVTQIINRTVVKQRKKRGAHVVTGLMPGQTPATPLTRPSTNPRGGRPIIPSRMRGF